MMNIKDLMKLASLGYRWKMTLISGLIFLLVGLGFEILQVLMIPDVLLFGDVGDFVPLGALFLMIMPMMFMQIFQMLTLSNFFNSSGKRREILTSTCRRIMAICMFLSYTVIWGIRLLGMYLYSGHDRSFRFGIMIAFVFALIFSIYGGLAYKIYWISMILFLAVYIPGLVAIQSPEVLFRIGVVQWLMQCPLWIEILIGYAILCLGVVLYGVFNALTYHLPLSPWVYKSYLKKGA